MGRRRRLELKAYCLWLFLRARVVCLRVSNNEWVAAPLCVETEPNTLFTTLVEDSQGSSEGSPGKSSV